MDTPFADGRTAIVVESRPGTSLWLAVTSVTPDATRAASSTVAAAEFAGSCARGVANAPTVLVLAFFVAANVSGTFAAGGRPVDGRTSSA